MVVLDDGSGPTTQYSDILSDCGARSNFVKDFPAVLFAPGENVPTQRWRSQIVPPLQLELQGIAPFVAILLSFRRAEIPPQQGAWSLGKLRLSFHP